MALPSADKLALEVNMGSIQAEEFLRDYGHELTPESLHRLTLEATGSRHAADTAYKARVAELLRRGETPPAG